MNTKLAAVAIFAVGFFAGFALDRWAGATIDEHVVGRAWPSTRLLLTSVPTSAPVVSVVTVVVERTQRVPVAVGDMESMVWTPSPQEASERRDRPGERGPSPTNDWFNQRFALFTNEWARRAAAARTNFIATAQLDDEGAARFDVVVASMNIRLSNVLDPVIADLQVGLPVTPEDRARLVHEVSEVVVLTYDEMARGLPDTPVSGVTSNPLNLVQFADPRYMPFLRGFSGRRSWGGGGPGGGGGGGGGPR